jgi:hypothetical protein
MGRVAKLKILEEPPVKKVNALARPPNMNRTPTISLMLERYYRDIFATNFV